MRYNQKQPQSHRYLSGTQTHIYCRPLHRYQRNRDIKKNFFFSSFPSVIFNVETELYDVSREGKDGTPVHVPSPMSFLGTLTDSKIPIRFLIDSGATSTLVAEAFVLLHRIPCEQLRDTISAKFANGTTTELTKRTLQLLVYWIRHSVQPQRLQPLLFHMTINHYYSCVPFTTIAAAYKP